MLELLIPKIAPFKTAAATDSRPMTTDEMAARLREFTCEAYPEMEIRVEEANPRNGQPQRRIFFTEPMFAALYPLQRFHYLIHLIPQEFYDEHLVETEWFELAPGEAPEDLVYPDDESVLAMSEAVLEGLERNGFFQRMQALYQPGAGAAPAECFGDFRHTKEILRELGYQDDEAWDAAHVLMEVGAFCDCEAAVLPEPAADEDHDHAMEYPHNHDHNHG